MSKAISLRQLTVTGDQGFACKVWLARVLEEDYLNAEYFVWFSASLNPDAPTGRSSNPLLIYEELDTAVKRGDDNHAKVQSVRTSLRQAVRQIVGPQNKQLARRLRRAVRKAPLDMFHPQLWKLDLNKIGNRKQRGRSGWDEFKIRNLTAKEFETIVE